MKTIIFRPLRTIQKTGKITVASYMQWRKVKTADFSNFNLIVDPQYKKMLPDAFVYDYKGKQLFWYNHKNPDDLPKNYCSIESACETLGIDPEYFEGEEYRNTEPIGQGFHWSVRGFDCDGVPVFSHYSADYIATHCEDMTEFEPLTVKMVTIWLGWFLYQLENSSLDFKK